MEECLDDDGSLWHVAGSHVVDGIGDDGLFGCGFGEHTLEGAEVVVGADA